MSHRQTRFCRIFVPKHPRKKSTVRQIYEIRLEEEEDRIWIWFYGNGFLYNMVRILTGTLVAAGTGAMTTADVMQVLEQKTGNWRDRRLRPRDFFFATGKVRLGGFYAVNGI